VVTVPDLTEAQALADLDAAYTRYLAASRALAEVRPCDEPWPADPPDAGYLGTRCQLLAGHTDRDRTWHRHRVTGSQAVVEWQP
jgi:hypothetical protein